MKTIWIAALAVPIVLGGVGRYAEAERARRERPPRSAAEERRPRGPGWGSREGGPGAGPRGPMRGEESRRRPQDVARLFRLVLHAARAGEDVELQELVDKTIADRRKMIRAEKARLDAFEALVNAVRSEEKEAIQAAREDMRKATERLRAATRQVLQDLKEIRDQLGKLRPEYGAGEGEREGPRHMPAEEGRYRRRRRERQERQERRPRRRREYREEDPLLDF